MRLKLLTLLIAAFALLLSIEAGAQNVTLNFQNEKLERVLDEISRQTGCFFYHSRPTVNPDELVSISVSDLDLQSTLGKLFHGKNITVKIEGKKVYLTEAVAREVAPARLTIKGVVSDATGEPIIGAAVLVKGSSTGTVTDLDGNYEIVASRGETLLFTCISYEDVSVTVGDKSQIDIVLSTSSEYIEDAVVVGYGVQKKVNLTGAVAAIDEKALADRPVPSVGQALQGMIPNLNITQTSGKPGAASNFNIRGNTSPNGGSPLILVDGVETALERINSNDIESITVLKDASSAAIYGARGAFGVILVTTKHGKEEQKPTVSLDARYSFSTNTVSTNFETRGYYSARIADYFYSTENGIPYTTYTKEDYQMLWDRRNDVTENPERPWVITQTRNGVNQYVYLANFDWYNYLYDETRPAYDVNLNVRGGSKKVSYFVSGRYYNQKGIMRQNPDGFESFNVRGKVDIKIAPWLTFGSNIRFFRSNYKWSGFPSDYDNFRKPTLHALATLVPVNPDGTAVSHTTMTGSSTHYLMDGYNALMQGGTSKGHNAATEVGVSFNLKAKIIEGLYFNTDFTYKLGYRRNMYRGTEVEYSMYPGEVLKEPTSSYANYLSDTVYDHNNYIANGYFSYDGTFKDAHHVTATAGVNWESRHYKNVVVQRYGLLSDNLNDFNLAIGDLKGLTGGINEYALMGFFFRATYDYKSRYLIEFNGRYDGSSRFLKGHRWGFFPSVSAAYRISEEPFFKKSLASVWNNAKIRLSYGSLGNQQIGYYDYYQEVNTQGQMDYSLDGSTKAPHAVVDDPVSVGTWETVVSRNIGLDLGFFRDKLTFSADVYVRDTKGILAKGPSLPSIYGATEPKINANDLRTKGYELQVTWKDSFPLAGDVFFYSIGASLSDYTAVYTRCDNPSGLLSDPYVGKQLGEIWGFRTDGFFKSDAEAAAYMESVDMSAYCGTFYTSTTDWAKGARVGDLKLLDKNGDGILSQGKNTLDDPGDREIIGNSQPRWSYGINAGINFYGFDFNIFFQGIGRQMWYPASDNVRFWGPYSRPYATFIPRDFMCDVWSETNPNAYFPRPRGYAALTASRGELYYTNDRYLQNLAYFRLKSLTIGYTLPEKVLEKSKISRVRFYFSGENLWYVAPGFHSRYIDPEVAAIDSDKKSNTYSFAKTFAFGVSMEF